MPDDERVEWLFLDLNSYFASVEQNENPELRGRPVIVSPVESEATCAIAASYEAKAYGIKTGTKIHEARRLCPGLVVVQARHDVYVRLHHRIHAEVDRHIPIEKVCSIDEVACRLMGAECEIEKARDIARRIKQGLRQNIGPCIRCSIGLAPNMFLAKIATNMQKPDGLVVITRADLPDKLLGLALRDLYGIGRGVERRLFRAGVYDIASLWRLSPKHARRIWGSVEGERYWYRLRGFEIPYSEGDRRSLGHSHVLAWKFRELEKAQLIARRLAMKAASRLRRLQYTTARLVLGVRFEKKGRWKGEMRTMRTQDTLTLLSALDRQWGKMQDTAPARARILKISVTFLDLLTLEHSCGDLFANSAPARANQNWETRRKLSFAIDRINRHYGRDTIWFGVNPDLNAPYTGTKIAFTRIPDMAEFLE